jgi:ribosome-associated heat shock protein Hsp15
MRIDRWLWHARFFRTRTLAARMVGEGRIRLNATPVTRPATLVRPGDLLTIPQGGTVHVVRVRAPGLRRGPAAEARALYETVPEDPPASPLEARPGGP